ncbi:pheromone autoinducer 2 transporter [Clostridium liquoris]|jgi:predicted PurR-regulated permease PerM|uniref:Pheromone autoinducer 2 transporter n=1 Tax=Clostridium liquoris TaxID=1289519 RepID=A0A2T0BAJ2_9CLOT|nr:AI-2E family transporter [Clostridium liquoris]PRR80827.1 pheromone autoinducer 2 transporter [Clostridium liquoris]
MEALKGLMKKDFTKRILVFLTIVLFFYLLRDFLDLILLTFLLTYLIYSLQHFIVMKINNHIHINEKFVTILLYLFLLTAFSLFIYKYVPIIINQSVDILKEFSEFKTNTKKYNIEQYLTPIFKQINIDAYLKSSTNFLIKFATNIGKWGFNIVIAFVLSTFFMLEKKEIGKFLDRFKDSKLKGFYEYTKYFGINFLNSFGKVIQAQILISIINTTLSVITLSILNFPQLLSLGLMVFLFGLIPVAGAIMSFIPLSIIAFNIGGFPKVLSIAVMVGMLHALESYVLNPKLMSAKTHLPVFVVFLVLIISEHFLGVWGLLIGIPLFIFLLDLLSISANDKG